MQRHLSESTPGPYAREEILDPFVTSELALLQDAPILVAAFRSDGTIRFVNQALEAICGYDEVELVGNNIWTLLFPMPAFAQVATLIRALNQGNLHGYELLVSSKGGQLHSVVWDFLHLGSTHDGRYEVLALGLDRSHERALEQKLATLLRQREQLISNHNSLLEGINFKGKTLLTTVLGGAQLLQRHQAQLQRLPNGRDQALLAAVAKDAAELARLSRIAPRLLRLDLEQRCECFELLDLSTLLSQVADELRASHLEHAIQCDVPAEPLVMRGERELLQYLFLSLVETMQRHSLSAGAPTMQLKRSGTLAQLQLFDPGAPSEIGYSRDELRQSVEARTRGLAADRALLRAILGLHKGTWQEQELPGAGLEIVIDLPLEIPAGHPTG